MLLKRRLFDLAKSIMQPLSVLGAVYGFLLCNTGCKPDVTTSSPTPFRPPAFHEDFKDDPVKQAQLVALWNENLNGFIAQGITGDPWNANYLDSITNYFNPTQVSADTLATAAIAEINWGAWPGRIGFYYQNLPDRDQLSISDRGLLANGKIPDSIPVNLCPQPSYASLRTYGPYGPRGFQDEYCEWSVQRDKFDKITRIDFTCENPEYWNSLWLIDTNKVLSIYKQVLDYAASKITMEDLILHDPNGKRVVDPVTGWPVYNPLNYWNSGSNGAMHLTSTPNTLQTEIGLATSSTLQRVSDNADEDALICCGQFGQNYRNSDPHIGGSVNRIVQQGFKVTLTNPPGLYIQMPNFSQFTYKGKPIDASKFWTIVRGTETLVNEFGQKLPGNFILHAKFEVPDSCGFEVGDLELADKPIQWGGQVARTINMQIVASALKQPAGKVLQCANTSNPSNPTPDPQQLFHAAVFNAMAATSIPNPMKFPMNLLSNSTYIAPKAKIGTTNIQMVLTTDNIDFSKGNPVITFDDPSITAQYVSHRNVDYAIPGNSYPSTSIALYINVNVGAGAKPGLHGVFLSEAGGKPGPPMPALINIVSK